MHRLLALAHYHERYAIPTAHAEATRSVPYVERGYVGFDELSPGRTPKRRTSAHAHDVGVES